MRPPQKGCRPPQAFLIVLIAILASVLVRCWLLQHEDAEKFRQKAEKQQLKIIPQSAPRGMIVDRAGRLMAVSTKMFSVAADPKLIENTAKTADVLAKILDMDAEELAKTIESKKQGRFIWVKRFIDDDQAAKVKAEAGNIRGVFLENEYQRQYPMGRLAAHLIGFTDIDDRGIGGLEYALERYLAGEGGQMTVFSDAARRPIASDGPYQPPKAGNSLILTIDAVIQTYLEEQLAATIEKFGAKQAVGIVMDPRNGEILAMANLPNFEPAQARNTEAQLRRNSAIVEPVEPGSTFKPFAVAAALEGGYIKSLEDKIDCLEGPYSGKGFGRISEPRNYHGTISVSKILVRSSNIGVAKLTHKMGKPYWRGAVMKFGFGQKTGVDLPGEDKGLLPKWDDKLYTSTRTAFGQGIAVTPLQLIRGFCCLANGGKLVRPHAVRAIMAADGKLIEDFSGDYSRENIASGRRVISENVAKAIVTDALVKVVANKNSSAHNGYIEGYEVFGKTGTAQIAKKDSRGYQTGKYISSFMAGAPANAPRICVLVMTHEPDLSLGLGYYGGIVSAPAVGEVLKQSLAYLDVPKQKKNQ